MIDRFRHSNPSRRRFLTGGSLALAAGLGMAGSARLLAMAGTAGAAPRHPGFGPLRPVADLETGLPLLKLPEGFVYRSFGWAGQALRGDLPCPAAHDGMGLVRAEGSILTLVRNHELVSLDGSFAPPEATYDPACSGGTVTLRFDSAEGRMLDAWPSLSGTLQNCAGGVTPWGSWLSCEEFAGDPGPVRLKSRRARLDRAHGYVFEVPADGLSDARPIPEMGRFKHEAAAFDGKGEIVYLTEDHDGAVSGFYRFLPKRAGRLADGGRLQMLRVPGQPDLTGGQAPGQHYPVEWVDIADPDRGIDRHGRPGGVAEQGMAAGASRFARLEGCIEREGAIYFTSTSGGAARAGQVWAYFPAEQRLALIFESPDSAVLDYPDNIVFSPRGGMVICQDSKLGRQRLYGLTAEGGLFEFALNNTRLDGQFGFSGDYRGAEWAGSCFSPDGKWLFANVYSPGFTVAITGPWRAGLI